MFFSEQLAGRLDLGVAALPAGVVQPFLERLRERRCDHIGGENVGFPRTVAMFGEIALGAAVARLDLERQAATGQPLLVPPADEPEAGKAILLGIRSR